MLRTRLIGVGTFFAILLFAHTTLAYVSPGDNVGYVNDFARILTTEQRNALETKVQDFERTTTNEIAVVTITSLGGDTIENYAVKLFEEWQIGKREEDNGVLLLVAKDDRKMRIEVGYGLEPVLPDATANHIIQTIMVPAFRQNDFYGGIDQSVDTMMLHISGAIPTVEAT
ncbi:TPM domain-containing protein, partial [Candidatus Gracilibacteria bacterium]|nr:TPM domain-containing protein [Candidatus Gracilibacteria bacterium]